MNLTKTIKASLLAFNLMGAGVAVASDWHGEGSVYDKERHLLSTYQIDLSKADRADGAMDIDVVLTFPDNSTKVIHCVRTGGEESWGKQCDDGTSGGGFLLDHGLASEYTSNADGIGYSSTFVFDADGGMRIMRYELKDGDAVRFFVESLYPVK